MPTQQILILVVMAAAFYFLLIRPQQQQAKRQAETIASLTPGTRVITIGGIYATVVSVEEDRIRVQLADGTELEIIRRAVASTLPDEAEDDHEDDEDVEDEPMLADSRIASDARSDTDATDETPADD